MCRAAKNPWADACLIRSRCILTDMFMLSAAGPQGIAVRNGGLQKKQGSALLIGASMQGGFKCWVSTQVPKDHSHAVLQEEVVQLEVCAEREPS